VSGLADFVDHHLWARWRRLSAGGLSASVPLVRTALAPVGWALEENRKLWARVATMEEPRQTLFIVVVAGAGVTLGFVLSVLLLFVR
jgi:hypothetical protein